MNLGRHRQNSFQHDYHTSVTYPFGSYEYSFDAIEYATVDSYPCPFPNVDLFGFEICQILFGT